MGKSRQVHEADLVGGKVCPVLCRKDRILSHTYPNYAALCRCGASKVGAYGGPPMRLRTHQGVIVGIWRRDNPMALGRPRRVEMKKEVDC